MSDTEKSLKVKLLFEVNKSLLKIKSKIGSTSFSQLGKPASLNIVCYSDATHVNLEDGFSPGGFIIFVCGRMNRMVPMYVGHQKNLVTKSLLTSETLVFNEAVDSDELIAAMLQEIFRLPRLTEVLFKTDSASRRNFKVIKSCEWLASESWCGQNKGSDGEEGDQNCMDQSVKIGADCLTKVGASSNILRDLLYK